jgi:hypothetical protein
VFFQVVVTREVLVAKVALVDREVGFGVCGTDFLKSERNEFESEKIKQLQVGTEINCAIKTEIKYFVVVESILLRQNKMTFTFLLSWTVLYKDKRR